MLPLKKKISLECFNTYEYRQMYSPVLVTLEYRSGIWGEGFLSRCG